MFCQKCSNEGHELRPPEPAGCMVGGSPPTPQLRVGSVVMQTGNPRPLLEVHMSCANRNLKCMTHIQCIHERQAKNAHTSHVEEGSIRTQALSIQEGQVSWCCLPFR